MPRWGKRNLRISLKLSIQSVNGSLKVLRRLSTEVSLNQTKQRQKWKVQR